MNPFRPTAGKMPPVLIGREGDISDFFQALQDGSGAPGRLMLVTGQRGYGKTVLLTEFCRMAHSEGWKVISETASEGLCQRIVAQLEEARARVVGANISPSVSIGGFAELSLGSVELSPATAPHTLRQAINSVLEHTQPGKGVMIAIDEVQAASRQDMVAIGTAVQHVIRDQDMNDLPDSEKRGVAVAFAGLPSTIDDLVNDSVLTFLRRAQRHVLGAVGIPDVRNAFMSTFASGGKVLSEELAWKAAEATDGFPYMVQLVGFYLWQASDARRSSTVVDDDLRHALSDAAWAFQDAVCAPAYHDLTRPQRRFVEVMAEMENPTLADIALAAERSDSWARKYRRSLVEAHVVDMDTDGVLRFEIPWFGEYLQRIAG